MFPPPAGDAAAGIISAAACFAAPVQTAGRSDTLLTDLLSLTLPAFSPTAHGRGRVKQSNYRTSVGYNSCIVKCAANHLAG